MLKHLACGRFEMDCAIFGKGDRKLVILPGMSLHPVTSAAELVCGAFRCFTGDYTVYLFGRKHKFGPGYMVEDMADDTVTALDMLGIGQADFYGASQGGMMAMSIASRFPSRVRRLALASTAAHPSAESVATMNRWESLALSGDVVALNRDIVRCVYSPEFQQKYAAAFALLEKQGTEEEMRAFALSACATRAFDIGNKLEKISCPVFVAGVENDTVLGSDGVKEIAAQLNATLKLYPGSGHACYDEDSSFPFILREFFCRAEKEG